MHHLARDTTTYTGNQADGDSTNFYGDVYGDVHLPPRPHEASEPLPHQCLRDLRVTDPREDRARIEGDKDRLLPACYAWLLEDESFQRWMTQDSSRLLWIKGDPGKGKTMMTMGVIDELSRRDEARLLPRTMSKMLTKLKINSKQKAKKALRQRLLTYFFCQSTRPELNNAMSVFRGLIYLLISQREDLMQHVQQRYKTVGKQLFEQADSVYALREILADMLDDVSLPPTYLLVDALDECTYGLSELLHFISDDRVGRRSRVKWLVTSRNIPEIERCLQPDPLGVKVSLEVKASHVSRAVTKFVEYKVQRLAHMQMYEPSLQAEVQQQLRDKAEGTFLWVSLVCKELEGVPVYRTLEVLNALPPGLDPLYKRMLLQTEAQDTKTADYCKAVLRSITLAFRPLQVSELALSAGLPLDQFSNVHAVVDIVGRCGSFLAIRANMASFIHLSARDYFMVGDGRHVFDSTLAHEHMRMATRLLDAMDSTLRRDICRLQKPDVRIHNESTQRHIKNSDLAQIAYACEHWVDHLCESTLAIPTSFENILQDQGAVDAFLQKKFLYWLEALSLCKSLPKGIVAIGKLWTLIQRREDISSLKLLIQDAHRFIMYHKGSIEASALQVYASALLFSPKKSLIRRLFKYEEIDYFTIVPGMSDSWNACLQTLEGHSDTVNSVVFSHDSARLASASWDRTVKIWDVHSGACLQTLEGYIHSNLSSFFSPQKSSKIEGEGQQLLPQNLSFSTDGVWIVHDSQLLLWLPSEYRPNCTAISGKCIGVGTSGGKVWIGHIR